MATVQQVQYRERTVTRLQQEGSIVFLLLEVGKDEVNRLGNYSLTINVNITEDAHSMCFSSASLAVDKICAIVSIKYIQYKWLACALKHSWLTTFFTKNVVK